MDMKRFNSICKRSLYEKFHKKIDEKKLSHINIEERSEGERLLARSKIINGILTESVDESIDISIQRLEEKRQMIIYLSFFAGLPDTAIGKVLNMPTSTVRYNKMKALDSLRGDEDVK